MQAPTAGRAASLRRGRADAALILMYNEINEVPSTQILSIRIKADNSAVASGAQFVCVPLFVFVRAQGIIADEETMNCCLHSWERASERR